jgi:hypothetical protein
MRDGGQLDAFRWDGGIFTIDLESGKATLTGYGK